MSLQVSNGFFFTWLLLILLSLGAIWIKPWKLEPILTKLFMEVC